MVFSNRFITANTAYCTFEKHIAAPCFRKSFDLDKPPKKAEILICGLGFYDLFINGKKITKGYLAPYISNPDDILYYDRYDVTAFCCKGKNVIGIILGNGMLNPMGGQVWSMEKASFRSAPKVALSFEASDEAGDSIRFECDSSFKTSPSAILFDDLRCGVHYDARKEQKDWSFPGFDDSTWAAAMPAVCPKGEPSLCGAQPVVVSKELKPVSIRKGQLHTYSTIHPLVKDIVPEYNEPERTGYLYDFGQNSAGVCRLKIKGKRGQRIALQFGEWLDNGELTYENINYYPDGYSQRDVYICSGEEEEIFVPPFTYHGFQYVLVIGITEEQATEDLLTYLVMHSDLQEMGSFSCSDPVLNQLQTLTRRSTLANFFYFPTDCPHREKNGWTGDATLSAEHTLLNLNPEKSYHEWLRNIAKAQNEAGAIPGIVPTSGWGFEWGNGPAWDNVLVNLPYFTYRYRGDKEILANSADAVAKYLHYIKGRQSEDGLIAVGLGDWCQPNRNADQYTTPLAVTDSITILDFCKKAETIFSVLERQEDARFARDFYNELRGNIRSKLVDLSAMTVNGNTQTGQAMAVYYDVFSPDEKPAAVEVLAKLIRQADNHMDTGILGARVIFHVLSQFGYSDLAYQMITNPTFPSYANWIALGATSLWEDFMPDGISGGSRNHHFFGDISNWFIQSVAGICLNPDADDIHQIIIQPHFLTALSDAEGWHMAPDGKIDVSWRRIDHQELLLDVHISETMHGIVRLESPYCFGDGSREHTLDSAQYHIYQNR